jgi:hypothetical protein
MCYNTYSYLDYVNPVYQTIWENIQDKLNRGVHIIIGGAYACTQKEIPTIWKIPDKG